MWILGFGLSLAAGWLLARGLTGRWDGPAWVSVLIHVSLGALLGPGLASVLYFFLTLVGMGTSRGAVLAMLAVLLAAGAVTWWRRAEVGVFDVRKASSLGWILLVASVVGLGFFLADFSAASSANPAGEWDAMSIWNLRAEFIAGGELGIARFRRKSAGIWRGRRILGIRCFFPAFSRCSGWRAGTLGTRLFRSSSV